MASFIDIIAGKIAVALEYITDEQLEKAMKALEQEPSEKLVGILLEAGLIDNDQLQIITARAKEEMERYDARFARFVVSMELLAEEAVEKAKQLQQTQYPETSLRNLLVETGILTPEQAQKVMDSLKEARTLVCPKCQKQYTQTSYQPGKSYKCPDCDIDLKRPRRMGSWCSSQKKSPKRRPLQKKSY